MKVLNIHEREISADASEVGSAPKAARVGKLRPYPFSIYAQYRTKILRFSVMAIMLFLTTIAGYSAWGVFLARQ